MKKNLKRRLYALALAGLIMSGVNTRAFAESIDDVDMAPIDIEQAIIELVPQENNNNNNNNNNNSNSGNNDNSSNNNNSNSGNNDNNNTNDYDNTGTIDNNNNNNNNIVDNDNSNNITIHVNHNYNDVADDVVNQKAPTCDKAGSYDEVYYCTDCGIAHIVHVDVPAPGHKWVDSTEKINETSTGYDVVQYCSNKGCNEKRTYHVNIDTPTEPSRPSYYPDENPKTADETLFSGAVCTMVGSASGLVGLAYLVNKDNSNKKYKGKYLSRK